MTEPTPLLNHQPGPPRWMCRWLIAAGVYNLAWGALTVLYPAWLFRLTGLDLPSYPFIWQCVGMIVGVYGIGYLAAARDPMRHWPIVLVGFLGKIFGPLGYVGGLTRGEVPVEFGWTLLTNDLIWWVPFAMMLYAAFKAHSAGNIEEHEPLVAGVALAEAHTESGSSLLGLSDASPVLLVFLRHSGCTFCRETVAELASQSAERDQRGTRLVLVHQGDPARLQALLTSHGLGETERIHDPERRLYRSLELERGSFWQLFGPAVWVRGFVATTKGHLVGRLDGDGFQMPGAFLVERGRVTRAFRHAHAAERPDYAALSCPTGSPA